MRNHLQACCHSVRSFLVCEAFVALMRTRLEAREMSFVGSDCRTLIPFFLQVKTSHLLKAIRSLGVDFVPQVGAALIEMADEDHNGSVLPGPGSCTHLIFLRVLIGVADEDRKFSVLRHSCCGALLDFVVTSNRHG